VSQLSLLDLPLSKLPARSTDPATSKASARALPIRARQLEVLEALRLLSVASTAEDVQAVLAERGMRREKNEVSSRLSELADERRWPLGALVRRCGVKQGRRGRPNTTFVLTAQGRDWSGQ
jgi:hypothetical protein